MTDTATIEATDVNVDQSRKEAYFTAGQGQLIWSRFKKQRAAMWGAGVLLALILAGIFAPFLTPYDPTIKGRNAEYQNGAPNIPKFWDENGFSFRPFIYTYERTRSIETNFRWVSKVNRDKRRYVVLFPEGDEYSFLGMTFNTHLFGVDIQTSGANPARRRGFGGMPLNPSLQIKLDIKLAKGGAIGLKLQRF